VQDRGDGGEEIETGELEIDAVFGPDGALFGIGGSFEDG
jgi:hypothetical protein